MWTTDSRLEAVLLDVSICDGIFGRFRMFLRDVSLFWQRFHDFKLFYAIVCWDDLGSSESWFGQLFYVYIFWGGRFGPLCWLQAFLLVGLLAPKWEQKRSTNCNQLGQNPFLMILGPILGLFRGARLGTRGTKMNLGRTARTSKYRETTHTNCRTGERDMIM